MSSLNLDTATTWRYHQVSKLSAATLRDPNAAAGLRARRAPAERTDLARVEAAQRGIPLSDRPLPYRLSALDALTEGVELCRPIDEGVLSRLCRLANGFRDGRRTFRAAACTGARYHVELYVVTAPTIGIPSGVHRYDPSAHSLAMVRPGDHRRPLAAAAGGLAQVATGAATFVCTSRFRQNASRYGVRSYRHVFWDGGTVLANLMAEATALGVGAKLIAGFVDDAVSALLCLDVADELPVALVTLGRPGHSVDDEPTEAWATPRTPDVTGHGDIPGAHLVGRLMDGVAVRRWWGVLEPALPPARPQVALPSVPPAEWPALPLDAVIAARRSSRRLSGDTIGGEELSTLLRASEVGPVADHLDERRRPLHDVYVAAHRVRGLPAGLYRHQGGGSLEVIALGRFGDISTRIALGQAQAETAAVIVYFIGPLERVLKRFGNRGYRVLQLGAGMALGRLYLAATALRLGVTGLTFLDDELVELLDPGHTRTVALLSAAVGCTDRTGATRGL